MNDVRRHAQDRTRLHAVEIHRLLSAKRNVVGRGVLEHRLHVVDGEDRRTAEHARGVFRFERVDARHEVVRPVRVDRGEERPARGEVRRDAGRVASHGRVFRAERPSALPVAAALAAEVDAELAACVRVDVDDRRVNFHEFDGFVETPDHLFVIRHAVGEVGDEHGVDARIRDDAHRPLSDGRRVDGPGLRIALLLPRESLGAETRHAFRTGRPVGAARDGRAAHGLSEHHAAQDRRDPGYRDGAVHAREFDVVGPGVADREDPHFDLLGLHGKIGVRRGADRREIGFGPLQRKHVPFGVHRDGELRRDEARSLERIDERLGGTARHRKEFLANVGRGIKVNRVPENVVTHAVGFTHGG